jgi:hypothetical protein
VTLNIVPVGPVAPVAPTSPVGPVFPVAPVRFDSKNKTHSEGYADGSLLVFATVQI